MRVSKHLDLAQPVATKMSTIEEIKFGFPNEYMMPSGAYYARWPGELEIAIAPNYNFFVWRYDYPNNPMPTVKRVNCDGLLQCLACIHHILQENNITFEGNKEKEHAETHPL